MKLPDFSLSEEVHFQPHLISLVSINGKMYPPEIILDGLNMLPAPRWSVTNDPVWEYLNSIGVIQLNEMVEPGEHCAAFKTKLETIIKSRRTKVLLPWRSRSRDEFEQMFPLPAPANDAQLLLFG